jgi:hypothetical protein
MARAIEIRATEPRTPHLHPTRTGGPSPGLALHPELESERVIATRSPSSVCTTTGGAHGVGDPGDFGTLGRRWRHPWASDDAEGAPCEAPRASHAFGSLM